MGIWVLGNLYKKQSAYYGAFPGNFLKRAKALFPDAKQTLHLFAGTVRPSLHEITLDCQACEGIMPSVIGDARHLPFQPASFDFVLADPPYSAKDAAHYGTPMIARGPVLREIATVVKPGGYVCWLDTVWPMYSKALWRQIGAVAVLVSTNTRVRCLSIFERV